MTTLISKAPQTGSPNCHTQHVLEWYIYKNNHVFFGDLRTQDVLNLNWDIWEVRCLHWATVCATSSAAWFRRHLTIFASPSSKMARIWTGKHASQSGVQTSDFYSFALKSCGGGGNVTKESWLDQWGFETLNFKSRNKPGTHHSLLRHSRLGGSILKGC